MTYQEWIKEMLDRIACGRSTLRDAHVMAEIFLLSVAASEELAEQFGPEGAQALLAARGVNVKIAANRVH